MEKYSALATQPKRRIKGGPMKNSQFMEQALDWMPSIIKHHQAHQINTNNSAAQVEPDLNEVQKYVDGIIKGAIERVKEENSPKPFKNKVGPIMPDDKLTPDMKLKRKTFKTRVLSLFSCCFKTEE